MQLDDQIIHISTLIQPRLLSNGDEMRHYDIIPEKKRIDTV